ncbi:hypothetical protein LCGC14_0363280 [marine sediment metagenome]|uniref:Uncharacterized protein n=1 Tax=marine sediment metagenome TaxID=412755 RepID=A0A0F9TQA3_9ZZZZ
MKLTIQKLFICILLSILLLLNFVSASTINATDTFDRTNSNTLGTSSDGNISYTEAGGFDDIMRISSNLLTGVQAHSGEGECARLDYQETPNYFNVSGGGLNVTITIIAPEGYYFQWKFANKSVACSDVGAMAGASGVIVSFGTNFAAPHLYYFNDTTTSGSIETDAGGIGEYSVVINETHIIAYVDGALNWSNEHTGKFDSDFSQGLYIYGAMASFDNQDPMKIDNLSIRNYPAAPNSAPNVPTITSPYNNEINNTRKIEFNSSDTEGDAVSYTIYINGTFNISTTTNVTVWNGSDGVYSLTMTANDSTGVSANSSAIIFTLDTTTPSWSGNQTNATLMKINGDAQFNITVTDSGSSLSYYIFSWNGTGVWSNATNGTISSDSVKLIINKSTNLSQGNTVGYRWYANDSLNQWNNSMLRTFVVANSVPSVPTVTSPYNGEINNTRKIEFNSSDVDGGTITYNIYINGTLNITTTTNVTDWNASDGVYNLTITAYDQINSSSNSSVIVFTLDATPPGIANITVAGLNRSGDTFYVNITARDNLTGINWTISQNQTGTWQNTTWSATWTAAGDWFIAVYSATITATKNTVFSIIGYVKDEANNIAQSVTTSLTVGNALPTITNFTFPTATPDRTNINITINWSNSSDADGDTVYYRLWVGDASPPTWLYYNNTDSNFTTNLSDGTYYFSVDVFDGTDYNSNTSIYRLDVDTTSPILYQNFTDPFNTSLTYFLINYTVTDEGDLWSVNSTVINSSGAVICSNGTINLSVNSYNYVYNCSLPKVDNETFNGTVIAYDAHTSLNFKISPSKINVDENSRKFDFDGVTVQMTSTIGTIEEMAYQELGDRYSFSYTMVGMPALSKNGTYHYIFKLPANAFYLATSQYQGHFIIPSKKMGIDFEGPKGTFVINKTVVHFYTTETNLTFNSIFSLNNVTDTFQLTVDNIAPRISYSSPTPDNGSVKVGNLITINVSFTEAHLDTCTLEWNGVNESMTINSTDSYCNITKATIDGTGYIYRVYANDTYGNINMTSIRNVTENSLPTATLLNFTPYPVYTNASVNITYTFTDAENQTNDASTFKWFNNSVVISGVTGNQLGKDNISGDINITAEVTPNDGYENGVSVNFSIITLSTIPNITYINLTPYPAYNNATIVPNITTHDNDGDVVSIYYNWYINGSWLNLSNTTTINLSADYFNRTHNVTLRATPFDVGGSGVEREASITILNIPLIITMMSPTSGTFTTWIPFQCEAYDDDVPKDTLLYTISVYYNNGSLTGWYNITNQSISGTGLLYVYNVTQQTNISWKCTVTDGIDTVSATIGNLGIGKEPFVYIGSPVADYYIENQPINLVVSCYLPTTYNYGIAYSWVDCNNDGYWDKAVDYTNSSINVHSVSDTIQCIRLNAGESTIMGGCVFEKETSKIWKDPFCSKISHTKNFCSVSAQYKVNVHEDPNKAIFR